MADEPNPGEMPNEEPAETPPTEQPKEKPAEITSEPKDASKLEAELEKTRKALKEANREAAERRKRLDELEEAEKKRQEDAMSETEKLNARLKQLEDANAEKDRLLKEKERQGLQVKVAKSVAKELGVSVEAAEGLAMRLQGTNEEELTEDAKLVLALLPKQEAEKPKTPPKLEPTNPGGGQKGETLAQKKARLLGGERNPWGAGDAAQRGGGVVIVEKD